jgi:predicted ATPase
MLTRLEIDNFRCFEGFVWEPARKQLILGANGCGKSSMMDALSRLKRFVAGDSSVERIFQLRGRTRWLDQTEQRFCLQAQIDGQPYIYRLVVGALGDPPRPVVAEETLDCADGALQVSVFGGQVTIKQPSESDIAYPLDVSRSVIASMGEVALANLLHRFRRWLNRLYCFRMNPFEMGSRAEGEDATPRRDLSNFAAWYRGLSQSHPKRVYALFRSLEETFESFDSVALQDAGENVRLLNAEFKHKGGGSVEFRFNELSEGQRCLICLYTILHFVVVEGGTVVIDEPESFVGLRELQPWLKTASRMVSEADGQLILISHNPELIDQWAPRHGVRFVRDGMTPVKVEPWHGDPESGLSPAELVARGWDDA